MSSTEFTAGRTVVAIDGERFTINGRPTYAGRCRQHPAVEGLLLNSRMVQATFDDLNPETRSRWDYPDGPWDPERNLREFLEALPVYRRHGLLAVTVNWQGGSPEGYSKAQPWHNSAWTADGQLRDGYAERMRRVIARADALGMVVIQGLFYFGQDHRLNDEAAVRRATDRAAEWVFENGFTNVLIEICNECDIRYTHPILKPPRVVELIEQVRSHTRDGRRLPVGVSYSGGQVPSDEVIGASDLVLLHGNGVAHPPRIAEMARQVRASPAWTPKPIVFNEDDHFDFDKPVNNLQQAISTYASWGYFDPGANDYSSGFQSVPTQWQLNTPRKQAFFAKVQTITGT